MLALHWSDETYRIFGLKPQEFDATYEAFLVAVHPDDREAVEADKGQLGQVSVILLLMPNRQCRI